MSGFFVSFEGIDGSGKSLQASMLNKALISCGKNVTFCREPGGTAISEKIREILLSRENSAMNPVTEVLLFAAARSQLISEIIRPALEKGDIVICDRFVDSNLAYQGFARGLPLNMITEINSHAIAGLWPDVTFLMDIDEVTAFNRRKGEREPDRMESEGLVFQASVANGFRELSVVYDSRYFVLDGTGKPDDIHMVIFKEVLKRLNLRG